MATQAEIDQVQERLDQVQAAIDAAVEDGMMSRSISGGGAARSRTRYSLEELRSLERDLRRRLSRMKSGWAAGAAFCQEK